MSPIRIVIDRDLTIESDGGLVARFAEPLIVHRVMDGEELAIVHAAGKIEGGMFATRRERRYGASWAAAAAHDVAEWGLGWSKHKRLGEDLFVAVADAEDHIFYHENAVRAGVAFDPNGAAQQDSTMDSELCSTGLGCSILMSVKNAKFFSVLPSGKLEPQMTESGIQRYLREFPLPDVLLRPLGIGNSFSSGLILGRSVVVGQDPNDKLWLVEDRNDEKFVIGAKTKKVAIDEALRFIASGADGVSRLNRVPKGFDGVATEQTWVETRTRDHRFPRKIVINHVGASYVDGIVDDYMGRHQITVTAANLMKKWERI